MDYFEHVKEYFVRALTKIVFVAFLAVATSPALLAREAGSVTQNLETRLFPTLTSMDWSGPMPRSLQAMLSERRSRIYACGMNASCRVKASQWSPDEEKELAQWGQKQPPKTIPNSQRRLMMGESTADAIVRELDGLNHILRVYGEGVPPRVPDIDGPDTDNVALFKNDVSAAVMRSSLNDHDPSAVFDPSVYLSCYLLDAADRLDAIHFEHPDPNQDVMAAKPAILWSHYPYSAILVLGVGPERQGVPLSSLSKLNVRLAADRYRKGLAPLIITSGGTVHPRRTRFAEALEMRRALIERYHIPPGAILADPHARHTTTNIRNATRLLIAFHAPLNKDVLTVSNPAHISMIESPDFKQRNMEDLGYIPGEIGKRLSPFEITFRPSTLSLRVDPRDPLDP